MDDSKDKQEQELGHAGVPIDVEVGQRLASTLKELVSNDDWENSLFLKTVRKKLQMLLDEVNGVVEEASVVKVEALPLAAQDVAGYKRVYILLYQFESTKLQNWQYSLKILTAHSVSRPTYSSEQQVMEIIRAKKDMSRYGYAIVSVRESDIYPSGGGQSCDQLGHELLTLKEGAIKLVNIIGLVHANKRYYELIGGELVYKGDRDPSLVMS